MSGPAKPPADAVEERSVSAASNASLEEVKEGSGASSGDDNDSNETAHGLLVLLRHGQSMWNRDPAHPDRLWRYAGSNDVALAVEGVEEALEAGDRLSKIPIDVVFASKLSRAINTCMISLSKHASGLTPMVADRQGNYSAGMALVERDLPPCTVLPIICAEQFNERNFGDLQGMPSTEHKTRYSAAELKKVRNDYHTKFPGARGESTEDVYNRAVPYFEQHVLPLLRAGKNVLLCSHGFTIRALIKYLDGMTVDEFNEEMIKEKEDPANCKLLAATGVPLLYRFDRPDKLSHKPKKMGAMDRAYELAHTCAPY